MHPLIIIFACSLVLNLIMFLPAYHFKTDKLTDISYAVTFVILTLYGLLSNPIYPQKIILFVMVLVWAIRLGSYLLIRIQKIGKDKRFDGRRENFWSFMRFWILQGIAVFIVLIPTVLYQESDTTQISLLSFIGFFIYIIGLLLEAFADFQKYNFINKPDNKGKWVNQGLWKYSRHPNYLGEILIWIGIYLYVIPSLSWVQTIVGLISPLFITLLLLFVSGIPMLEKAADKKWGDNSDYATYKKSTGILFPKFNSNC